MKQRLAHILGMLTALAVPLATYAAVPASDPNLSFKALVVKAVGIMQALFQVVFWLIFFYVAFTLVQQWVKPGGDVKKGRDTAIAGVIGLVVVSSMWGIIAYARYLLLP